MKNYYEILNLNYDSTPSDITKAYRKYYAHNSSKNLNVEQAYKILANPLSRVNYDRVLNAHELETNAQNMTKDKIINPRSQYLNLEDYSKVLTPNIMSLPSYFYQHKIKTLTPILISTVFFITLAIYFGYITNIGYVEVSKTEIKDPLIYFLPNLAFVALLVTIWFRYLGSKNTFIACLLFPVIYNFFAYAMDNSIPYGIISGLYLVIASICFGLLSRFQKYGYKQTITQPIAKKMIHKRFINRKPEENNSLIHLNLKELSNMPGTMIYHNVKIPNIKNPISYVVANGERIAFIQTATVQAGNYSIKEIHGEELLVRASDNQGTSIKIENSNNLQSPPENFLRKPYLLRNYLLLENKNSEPIITNDSSSFIKPVDMNKLFNELTDWFATDTNGGINYLNHKKLLKHTKKK